MNLLQIQYFMAVAQALNFTKAAAAVFTSQSNISKQISKLESELDVLLFIRNTNGVALTPAGDCLYQGLLELAPRFNLLLGKAKELDRDEMPTLRIGFSDSMDFNRVMPKVFETITTQKGNIDIIVEAYPLDKVVEKLLANEIDVAISFNLVEANVHNASRHPISRTNSLIYYAKSNPLYRKENLELKDFQYETFYLFDNPRRKKEYDPIQYLPFTPAKVVKLSSMHAVVLNIERGDGISIFGQSQNFLGKDSLATFPLDIVQLTVGADAIWLNDSENKALAVFTKYLRQCYPHETEIIL